MKIRQQMGWSTGLLSKSPGELGDKLRTLARASDTAAYWPAPLEVHWGNPKPMSPKAFDALRFSCLCLGGKLFPHQISLHMPNAFYPSEEMAGVVRQAQELARENNISTVVFHPGQVKDFSWLEKEFGAQAALENMGIEQERWKCPWEFIPILNNYPFGAVFDVNHAFSVASEVYSAKELTTEFLSVFGDRLRHAHFSSYQGKNSLHLPYSHAPDANQLQLLSSLPGNIPWINEGVLPAEAWDSDKLTDFMQKELQLVQGSLAA